MFYKEPMRPFDPVIQDETTGLTHYVQTSFSGTGVDNWTQPPAQDQSLFTQLTNVQPVLQGTISRRWGYNIASNPAVPFSIMGEYQNDITGARRIIATGPNANAVYALNEDGSTYVGSIFSPLQLPRFAVSRGNAYFASSNVNDIKVWNGNNTPITRKWGIAAAVTSPTLSAPSSGSITLTEGRKYFVVFQNTANDSGNISDLGPVSPSTGKLTAQQVPLTNIPTSPDSQVTQRLILATADGGDETTLYLLHTIADNSTTTYTDNTDEATLLAQNIYQENDDSNNPIGVADNQPYPTGAIFPTKHMGRIFAVNGQLLYFSKGISELLTSTNTATGRYEECWPPQNFLDMSENAEVVSGLISDGTYLYIGTERHVRRLSGTDPNSFSVPDILFNEVGVMNQEVWKVVYNEGNPVGFMWLTPDFRVMLSNGNTYQDVGTPIQTSLSGFDSTNYAFHAMAASFGAYSFYMLFVTPSAFVGGGSIVFVYDLRTQRWFEWILQSTEAATASVFNINASGIPQLYFSCRDGKLRKFSPSNLTDSGTAIPVTIQTTWLHMGSPNMRKVLNELEVITDDTTLSVTVAGANKSSEFANGGTIVATGSLVASPLGPLKLFLAGHTSKFRYYQLTFTSSMTLAGSTLESYNMEFYPFHSL